MRRKCAQPKDIDRRQPKPPSAISPFHEAMHRRTRRIRHSWQVFGLAGTHSRVHLMAVASQFAMNQCG